MAVAVRLLTRANCHLCEDARAVVAAVCADAEIDWSETDVDSDETLRSAYTDHVPVVLIDERVFSYWFVDANKLSLALSQRTA